MLEQLSKGRRKVEDLNGFIRARLLKHQNGNSRARRLAWLRNKGRVTKFSRDIQDICDHLVVVITTNTLSAPEHTSTVWSVEN